LARRASLRIARRRATPSSPSERRRLRATARWSSVSWARRTSPIPPCPSTFSTRKRPTRVWPGKPVASVAFEAEASGGSKGPLDDFACGAGGTDQPSAAEYTPQASGHDWRSRGPSRGVCGRVERSGRMKMLLPARLLAALAPEADGTRQELPGDVVLQSRRRIGIAAAIGAGAYALLLAVEASGMLGGAPLERRIDIVHDVLGLSLCASLLLAASARSIGDRWALRLALVAEVLLATLISVAVPWAAFLRTAHLPALTW